MALGGAIFLSNNNLSLKYKLKISMICLSNGMKRINLIAAFRSMRITALIVLCHFAIESYAQRDTFALYEMGEVGRIDGLSYGSHHSLLLFTDSTFTYSVYWAAQISTGLELLASGTWTKNKELFTFTDTLQRMGEVSYNSCTVNPERKNLFLRFNIGQLLTCFNLPPVTIYCQGSVRVIHLQVKEDERNEPASQLEKYVPYFYAETETDLACCDSLQLLGMTIIPGEPGCNQFGFSVKPPFMLNLEQRGDDLGVPAGTDNAPYIFYKTG